MLTPWGWCQHKNSMLSFNFSVKVVLNVKLSVSWRHETINLFINLQIFTSKFGTLKETEDLWCSAQLMYRATLCNKPMRQFYTLWFCSPANRWHCLSKVLNIAVSSPIYAAKALLQCKNKIKTTQIFSGHINKKWILKKGSYNTETV